MKKIFFIALVSASTFFTACGDDSSSTSAKGTSDLPTSVKKFEDIMDIECNAERKCAKILIEEFNDYMECDGVQQWNTVSEILPSKVCPAETPSTPENSEDTSENDVENNVKPSTPSEDLGDDSQSSTPGNDEPVENETNTEDEKTEGGETSSEGEATTAKMVSCMLNVTMSMGGMEFSTKSCTEVAEGDAYVATLNAECIDASSEADGMAVNQKAEIGSACEEGYKVKCTGSAGNTVYLYDEDAVDCEGVK